MKPYALFAGLAVVMAATRFDHFGAIPDASLAVFLLGGMFLGGAGAFAGLFALAFAVDMAATELEAWRAYCMTPAYWGLLPTFALLWLGGLWLGRGADALSARRLLPAALGLFSLAFIISNLSWWGFSHRFDMGFVDFWLAVASYYPPYLAAGLLYVGLFVVAARSVVRPRPAAV
jgi:hypothetical protein